MNPLLNDIERVLYTDAQVKEKITEIAALITRDYEGINLVMIGILKGAVMFFAELTRQVELPVCIDFMSISSYGMSTKTSGTVRILKDLDISVEGKHVLIVEDIVDSGLTLDYLVSNMKQRKVASVKVCTLLDKVDARKTPLTPDYSGFRVPNEFLVGWGLDYQEKYRNLREVGVLKRSVYSKT